MYSWRPWNWRDSRVCSKQGPGKGSTLDFFTFTYFTPCLLPARSENTQTYTHTQTHTHRVRLHTVHMHQMQIINFQRFKEVCAWCSASGPLHGRELRGIENRPWVQRGWLKQAKGVSRMHVLAYLIGWSAGHALRTLSHFDCVIG